MYANQVDMPQYMPPPPGMIPNAARAAAAAAWAEREARMRVQKQDSAMPDYSDYLNAPMGTDLTPEQCAQLGVPPVVRCEYVRGRVRRYTSASVGLLAVRVRVCEPARGKRASMLSLACVRAHVSGNALG